MNIRNLAMSVAALALGGTLAHAGAPARSKVWSAPDGSIRYEYPPGWREAAGGLPGRNARFRGPENEKVTPTIDVKFVEDSKTSSLKNFLMIYGTGASAADGPFLTSDSDMKRPGKPARRVQVDGRTGYRFEAAMHRYIGLPVDNYVHTPTPEERREQEKRAEEDTVWVANWIVVVPAPGGYWLFEYDALDSEAASNAPAFEHLLKTVKLKAPKRLDSLER